MAELHANKQDLDKARWDWLDGHLRLIEFQLDNLINRIENREQRIEDIHNEAVRKVTKDIRRRLNV